MGKNRESQNLLSGPPNEFLSEAPPKREGRVLGIDLGTRRIGLAISDPLWLTAQGLPTLRRQNKRHDLNFLKSLVQQWGVSLIVLGNPLNMNGSEGSQSAKAREFAAELGRHLNLEIRLWDERLTSWEAQQILEQSGRDPSRNPEAVDRVAAALLLQGFLDSGRAALEREA